MQQDDKSRHEIRKIAYALWIKDGQPEGRDREHWEAAKEIWAFRSHNHVLDDDATAPSRQQAAETPSTQRDSGTKGARRQSA